VTFPGLQQLAVAFAKWILPLVMNRADLILATSPQLATQLEELGCRGASGSVGVWRKGIDTNIFNPKWAEGEAADAMRTRLTDGDPDAPLLLYVGRLGAEKNVDLLTQVLDLMPEARLAIVGAGPHEDALREAFAGKRAHFAGLMTGEDLSRAYACADVFCMPSESETLGFVVLEAMASGTPAVAARAGGIPNLVEDGKTSFLHTPGDASEIVRLVREMYRGGGTAVDAADPDNALGWLEGESWRERQARAGSVGKTVAEFGREETLKWDWGAATSVLRNEQYTRAENSHRRRRQQRKEEREKLVASVREAVNALLGWNEIEDGSMKFTGFNTTSA